MYIDGLMFGIIYAYVLCLCVGSGCGENVYVIVRYCRHLVDQTTEVNFERYLCMHNEAPNEAPAPAPV